MFNQEGAVSEASSSNIFYIKEKKLFTPDLSSLCLPGIMRKQIIQLAHELKIPITEKRIKESELAKAEAIFLTNSIRGLIPVNEWGKHSWNSHSHPMVKFLKNCLVQYVLTLP
ncbi:MAG: aminotransferase class IV [Bacteroidota bacterium]